MVFAEPQPTESTSAAMLAGVSPAMTLSFNTPGVAWSDLLEKAPPITGKRAAASAKPTRR